MIGIQVESSKQLFYAIQNDGFVTDNLAYNDTIQNGIPIFFSAYDVDFAAHETPASIDYPLSNDKMDLVGVEYIYSYLQKLFMENQFCKIIPAYDIHCLLRGYDDHYQDLLINIFGLVLTNMLGSVLASKNAVQLNIKPLDRQYLQRKLVNLSIAKLDAMEHKTSNIVSAIFRSILPGSLRYLGFLAFTAVLTKILFFFVSISVMVQSLPAKMTFSPISNHEQAH